MAYEHKDGSGSLFKNDKAGVETRPDYRGDVMVAGVLYEIAGWLKPKASNPAEKYMSLAIKPKQRQQRHQHLHRSPISTTMCLFKE